jgi:uncharacterized protein (TIGR02266 family)
MTTRSNNQLSIQEIIEAFRKAEGKIDEAQGHIGTIGHSSSSDTELLVCVTSSLRSARDTLDSPLLSMSQVGQYVDQAKATMEHLRAALGPLQHWQDEMCPEMEAAARIQKVAATFSGISIPGKAETMNHPKAGRVAELTNLTSKALRALGPALAELDQWNVEAKAVDETTRIVARTLALLHPVSLAEDNPPRMPAPPPEMALADTAAHNRRDAQRQPIEAKVGFQSDTNFFTGFTEDISTGGIFIATYETKVYGEQVKLSFTLPNGHLINAPGIVRWVREFNELAPDTVPGMGVQFEALARKDHEAISSFIEQRPPLFFVA